VSIDNALGGRMIGKRLYESGHRRVAALAPELSLNLVERIEGVRYALTERGLPPEAVLTAPPLSKEEFAAGWEAFHREHPDITAVFCANSHVGYNFLEYAGRTGLAIPQALSVVGFDEPIAPIRALTAVRQPTQAIGQAAAKLMLELSASRPGRVDYPPPQRILLAPELEEGDTLAPPPSAPPQD
jgi:LacI family transcriptional regulator